MNINYQKKLKISCICSIYIKTNLNQLILAIDSLLIQKYIPNEIIIILDGKVNKEIEDFLVFLKKRNSIFKILRLSKNSGLGVALKLGIEICKNDIIARFDADDINLQDRLKKQYDLINSNRRISIVGSSVIEFKNYSNKSKYQIKDIPLTFEDIKINYMHRNPLNHPTVIFKKKDIIKVGSYKNIKFFEDYELWIRCIKNKQKIINIAEPLVAMRRESYLANRRGIKYALYEILFIKSLISNKYFKFRHLPFFILRIIIRFFPYKITINLKRFDKLRSNEYLYDLESYINKLKTENKSIYSTYNSHLKKS